MSSEIRADCTQSKIRMQPLALPEHTRLEVQLVRRRRPTSDQRKLAYDALQAAGIISAPLPAEDLPTISEAQLAAARVTSPLPVLSQS